MKTTFWGPCGHHVILFLNHFPTVYSHEGTSEIISEAYISDATYLNRFGDPTGNYGPAGRLRTTSDSRWDPNACEHVSIQELYDCTRVYVSMILNVCSRQREDFVL